MLRCLMLYTLNDKFCHVPTVPGSLTMQSLECLIWTHGTNQDIQTLLGPFTLISILPGIFITVIEVFIILYGFV